MILLDANVLVYSVTSGSPQHRDSRDLVRRAAAGEVLAILVPQVLLEAYSTVTSPRRIDEPLSPRQAADWLSSLRRALEVRPVPRGSFEEFETLVATHPRAGSDIFDLFLVAQMRCLGISDICTYNTADFALPGVRAVEPSQV